MSRKVVLATVGTLGDLHPFLALALALRERGVVPLIASAAEYRAKVEAAGIDFHPVRPSFDDVQRDLGMDRAEVTRQTLAQGRFLFRKILFSDLRATYEDMLSATADADLVLTSSLAFAARLAAEKRGIPWIAIVLQPMMFLSAYDPPVIPRAEWLSSVLRRLGPTPSSYVLSFVKGAVGKLFKPVHRLRREIGLPPSRQNPMLDGQFSAAGAIGLYSPVMGGVQPDYPRDTSIVGFAFYDSEHGRPARLEADLEAFLASGEAPLVFTLGSLIVNSPGSFYQESLAAARLLGKRAVLLVGENGVANFAAMRAPDIFVGAYAPHSLVFARAAIIVHQGGIGTLAQALRCGRPQLIVPFFADQLDNAARAERIGVARTLSPERYTAPLAAAELRCLLAADRYAECAAGIAKTIGRENGPLAAAAHISHRLTGLNRRPAA